MPSASIFKLPHVSSLAAVAKCITETGDRSDEPRHPKWPGGTLTKRWDPLPSWELLPQSISSSERDYSFIAGQASVQVEKSHPRYWFDEDEEPRDFVERIIDRSAPVLFFQKEDAIFCVILTNSAQRISAISEHLLPSNIWGDSAPATEYTASSEFMVWLIHRWMSGIHPISDDLRLEKVTAYQGKAHDGTQTVIGAGDALEKVPATLTVIFDGNPIGTIQLDISSQQELLSFTYHMNGNVRFLDRHYQGHIAKQLTGAKRWITILVWIYKEVLPRLFSVFKSDRSWSPRSIRAFQIDIGLRLLDVALPRIVAEPESHASLLDVLLNNLSSEILEQLNLAHTRIP